jgi:hypothetical protein
MIYVPQIQNPTWNEWLADLNSGQNFGKQASTIKQECLLKFNYQL